ncbi:MAG: CRTAC1 family protein [Acidobacteria bacterium]|nr:CRTAC1 family protein [Acidobacteriota bacterium]
MVRRLLLAAVIAAVLPAAPAEPPAAPLDAPAVFVEATAAAGLDFRHDHGGSGRKYTVETMGSGACFLDYDGDSWQDLYLVNGAPLPGSRREEAPRDRLFRNRGDGTFEDVTERAGVGDPGYGMGCSAADIDDDGDVDLYVTNFGPNVLYVNQGDGTFRDGTASSGLGDPLWGTSSAFADYDRDGDLDLYLCNYVDFRVEENKYCGDFQRGLRSYCHPDVYEAQPDRLFRNDGGGRFTDVTRAAGIVDAEGKGLGVVWTDYDRDGFVDLYVANDSTPNFLFRNRGDGTFQETTLIAGVGYSEDGQAEAGMGTDAGDVDNDGWPDLFVANLSRETNTLYRNNGDGTFTDRTFAAGLGPISLLFVGFGVDFLDYDLDGDQDLVVVNGHVLDDIQEYDDAITYAERNFLFENRGDGTFEEAGLRRGPDLARPNVGRGLAVADYDRDGDPDLLITTSNGPARLLRNDRRNGNHWLHLDLRDPSGRRAAIGARVTVVAGGRAQAGEVRSGSSYLSQNEFGLHFGLGRAERVDSIAVVWPDGRREVFPGPAPDAFHTLRQGTGRIGSGG